MAGLELIHALKGFRRTWLAWLVGKGQAKEESGMENCEYAPLVCAAVRLCSCTELQ